MGRIDTEILAVLSRQKSGLSEIRKRSEHLPRKPRADRYIVPPENLEMASGQKLFRNEAVIIRYDYRVERPGERPNLRIAN
jgi:hypothetical protein